MPNYRIVDRLVTDDAAERRALLADLMATPASIPPKYFYDAVGSALFGAICELAEYYPTRTERAIFARQRTAIAAALGQGKQLVDLGAGDGSKALAWLPVLAPSRYIAVDIAAGPMTKALAGMAAEFPDVEMLGVITDFTRGLDLSADLAPGPVNFFYPGSSIGNFTPAQAREFLEDIRRHCAVRDASGLLIGVDTKKDRARLNAAYDDAAGVTAAFNRNVLNHVNRFLGSDFHPRAFVHRGFYNEEAGCIEMHLEAATPQTVRLADRVRVYLAGERIHTESSWKYTPAEFTALLHASGFADVQCWQDDAGDFAVFHARSDRAGR